MATIKKVTKKQLTQIFNWFAYTKTKWSDNHVSCTTTDVLGLMTRLKEIGVAASCQMCEDGVGHVRVDYNRVINHYNYRKQRGY